MKRYLVAVLLFLVAGVAGAQVQSPDEFLGYPLGSQFTPHAQVVAYFRQLTNGNDRAKLFTYGQTYEGRALLAAVISSKENIANLEDIRKRNLALTAVEKTNIKIPEQPAILYLSYNVHGNEASSTETAMKMLYALLAPTAQVTEWLKNTVVIIDPCLNPDGRDRYVNFFNSVRGKAPNPDPFAREHNEPWPGGRVNHYYFDLNRDWAWQTQIESRQRLAFYQKWMPQVHVDFHEQSYNEPYYFAPAAEPVHQAVTPWQKEFQVMVGKNNAKYFDENGWQYFTKERFDLLYPAYGDTYPLYNGAIGMTYEQGGIRAGLAVITADGDTLTLSDRIDHHFATGVSTLETVSANAGKLLQEYRKYFEQSGTTTFGYKSYIVKADNIDRLKKLADLLKANNITYAFGSDKMLSGFNYETQKTEAFRVGRNDMVVNTQQTKGVLANVLFEPQTVVTDSNTYDITAWALPYVYGLNAYAVKEQVKGIHPGIEEKQATVININKPYAWLMEWSGTEDAKSLIALQKAGVKVRIAEEDFATGGREYRAGSLLIYRTENEKGGHDVTRLLSDMTKRLNKQFYPISSGYVETGKDFGSNVYRILTAPRIGVAVGPEVSAQGSGEIWHLLDQELNYPYLMLSPQSLGALDINKVNVLILPDGSYSESLAERLAPWVSSGGKLILIEDAIGGFIGKKQFDIARKELPKETEKKNERPYSSRDKDDMSNALPGAIFKVTLDNTHPMNLGLGSYYYALKTDEKLYEPLKNGWSTGSLKPNNYVSGIAGKNVRAKLESGMLYGVQHLGRGCVIYLGTDVLFRSFWESGKQMFINGLFLVD